MAVGGRVNDSRVVAPRAGHSCRAPAEALYLAAGRAGLVAAAYKEHRTTGLHREDRAEQPSRHPSHHATAEATSYLSPR